MRIQADQDRTDISPTWPRRLLWFAALWCLGVGAVASAALLIRSGMRLAF